MSTAKRLTKLLYSSNIIPFDDDSKFIIMSDCHRGSGNWSDNFSSNQTIYFAALNYYFENNYSYIELGDGDELWENRKIESVIETHSDVFWLMSLFYQQGRMHMLYGNHDIVKMDPRYAKNKCSSFYCDSCNSNLALFPNITITEGLILKYLKTNDEILLAHGHQGDLVNDTLWRVSRFLIRYLWKPLELIGIRDPFSTSKNNKKKGILENKMSDWSKKNNQMLIVGHTHHPMFPNPGEPLYFNDGSCVHPRCITGIEIVNGSIALIKWSFMTRSDQTLYVGKEILSGPVLLTDFFQYRYS